MVNIKDFKILKYHTFLNIILSIICSKSDRKDDKVFKEEESIEILKILGLINKKK